MDQLNAMLVFTQVVDTGSFSQASKKLNMPLPSVSRKVADLEAHLGAQLLVRTTRKLSLTESGTRYLESARRILNDVQEAERQASGEYLTPIGQMTLTAPSAFGRLHVLPVVEEFLKNYPDVTIRLLLADQVLHLLDEQVDLGLRIGDLSDSTMIAKHLGFVEFIQCASPQYLMRKGIPTCPQDLKEHDIISFGNIDLNQTWEFADEDHLEKISLHPRLIINSAQAAVDCAINGMGITRVLSYQASQQIADKTLQRILATSPHNPKPVNFVYPQGRLVPLKLRTFIDFAAPRIKERLAIIKQQCA
ncbi:MAG: LysR family transcriptional regulator [Methylocystaceae bacterium]|nr:LysR family transcriptional regulator [Methylocystaceae bacterium]